MGHLHRQALVQRAKARDALIEQGMEPAAAKASVAACSLAVVNDPLASLVPKARASAKTAARNRGKKRGTKKKA